MIRRHRQAKYRSTSAATGSDTDALQTDVMRFMSIIGLCLMAVFALLQGIPLQESGKPSQPSQPARLREEISLQQQQVRELQAQLQELKSSMYRTQQRLTSAKEHLEIAAGRAQRAHEERERLQTRLENLEQQLEQQRLALADVEQDSRHRQQNLDKIHQRLISTQSQLDRNRDEIRALQHQLQQQATRLVIERQASPAAMPKVASVPAPKIKPAPEQQGFTLRFESDTALDQLVAAGSVTLYAMANQRAWRLSMTGGRAAAVQTPFPRWYHEMSAATVPAHYSGSLEITAPSSGRSTVVWGVQLPVAAKQDITSLTRQRQGGALLIQGDGKVILED